MALYAISDMAVLPSFYREGMPRALLEAASMGLAIITTDAPGCREVVEHNRNGFLVPPKDIRGLSKTIIQLVGDAGLRRKFGEESRRRTVARFDISHVARQFESAYQKMMAPSGR